MMGTYAHATDVQAANKRDDEQQQEEAKLHKELLEHQAKDRVDDDDDDASELVLNIDCCSAWSQLQSSCVLVCVCLRMCLFLFS